MDSSFFTLDSLTTPATLTLTGNWTIKNASELTAALSQLKLPAKTEIIPSKLTALDTVGAWMLLDWIDKSPHDLTVKEDAFTSNHALIYQRVKAVGKIIVPPPPAKPNPVIHFIEKMGESTLDGLQLLYQLFCFLGTISATFFKTLIDPKAFRGSELSRHIIETGFNAIPIIAMMGFLISIVLAYQGAFQLRKLGAEIYTIDLVAISVLREMGVLITAIMVAGRSGSAFAAEIGVMKVNEEIDALRTMGLSPISILVLPRMIALAITLPLLTFIADMTGLLGTAILMMPSIGISFSQFAQRVHQSISFSTFAVGILKAPVFAGIIALVGCLCGMKVTGSAESVGEMTTKAVVGSIVLVIITDAFFSLLFTKLSI